MTNGQTIALMCDTQKAVNKQLIGEDWRDRDLDWKMAVIAETVELIGHETAWEWWKTRNSSKFQMELEIADVWAFLSSWAMSFKGQIPHSALKMVFEPEMSHTCGSKSFLEAVTGFKSSRPIDLIYSFRRMLKHFDMSLDRLCRLHAAKSSLNIFRNLNGYSKGDYVKQWCGYEDNYWLEQFFILHEDVELDKFEETIFNKLQAKYLRDVI